LYDDYEKQRKEHNLCDNWLCGRSAVANGTTCAECLANEAADKKERHVYRRYTLMRRSAQKVQRKTHLRLQQRLRVRQRIIALVAVNKERREIYSTTSHAADATITGMYMPKKPRLLKGPSPITDDELDRIFRR
jgi:hypothetical protein